MPDKIPHNGIGGHVYQMTQEQNIEIGNNFKKLDTSKNSKISFEEFFAPKRKELQDKNVSYTQLQDEIAKAKNQFDKYASEDGELNIAEYTLLEVDSTPKGFFEGKSVANALIGYTFDKDQEQVSQVLENMVDERNVLQFLKGYNACKNEHLNESSSNPRVATAGNTLLNIGSIINETVYPGGDNFFEQLQSESGFPNKEYHIKDIAQKLCKCLQNRGKTDLSEKIQNILTKAGNAEISREEAAQLDKIAALAINK